MPNVQISYPAAPARRAQILSAAEAKQLALEYRQKFDAEPAFKREFAEGLKALASSAIGEPLLVKRSDKEADAYFIVPFNEGEATAGAVLIDAYSGQLNEATYVKRPIRYLANLRMEPARDLFLRKLPMLRVRPEILRQLKLAPSAEESGGQTTAVAPATAGTASAARAPHAAAKSAAIFTTFHSIDVDERDVSIKGMELVWEPATETQNPYYPVWAVKGTVKGAAEAGIIGYVTAKGDVVDRLTAPTALKGGGF